MLPYVKEHVNVRVERTIDPTLLAEASMYDGIIAEPQMKEKYILLYSRRYNKNMEQYAERMAEEKGLKLVEISIRSNNAEKGHIMRYDAGVEEFLSLVFFSYSLLNRNGEPCGPLFHIVTFIGFLSYHHSPVTERVPSALSSIVFVALRLPVLLL